MKAPEEIALIGGGILLSSGLVFGLKSGAASELPNVSRSVDTVLQGKKNADSSSSSSSDSANAANQAATRQKQQQEQAQQQQADKFNDGFKQAQQKGWQTGNWGSAKFYVDDNENMHVGSGQLSGSVFNQVDYTKVKTINLDGAVQAPQDSSFLFARTDYGNSPLTQINSLSNLDTSNTTDMEEMFEYNSSLSNLDLSHFDTSKVTNMANMFTGDSSISSLDVSHFDTSNATNMEGMFDGDSSLNNLDLSHFNTHNVTNMYDMFYKDNSLNSLDVSHFDTSNVANMDDMFEYNSSLSNLDVSHFDTSKVTDMSNMFTYDSSLSNINLSHFDTSKVTNMYEMFNDANIQQLTLGSNTKLQNNPNSNDNYNAYLNGTYQNNGQTLNIDGNAHPGTWYKQ